MRRVGASSPAPGRPRRGGPRRGGPRRWRPPGAGRPSAAGCWAGGPGRWRGRWEPGPGQALAALQRPPEEGGAVRAEPRLALDPLQPAAQLRSSAPAASPGRGPAGRGPPGAAPPAGRAPGRDSRSAAIPSWFVRRLANLRVIDRARSLRRAGFELRIHPSSSGRMMHLKTAAFLRPPPRPDRRPGELHAELVLGGVARDRARDLRRRSRDRRVPRPVRSAVARRRAPPRHAARPRPNARCSGSSRRAPLLPSLSLVEKTVFRFDRAARRARALRGQRAQAAAAVEVREELGRDDRGEAALEQRRCAAAARRRAPRARRRSWPDRTARSSRATAATAARRPTPRAAGAVDHRLGAEHQLARAAGRARQVARGDLAQDPLVAAAAELEPRRERRGERDDLLVEERETAARGRRPSRRGRPCRRAGGRRARTRSRRTGSGGAGASASARRSSQA